MKNVIVVGDATSHGGKVITGQADSTVLGSQVACVGDLCTCPEKGHDNCTIVEGSPLVTINGKAVAFDGHKTSCGATLLASNCTSGLV
jgi:uncharacterized Zn-binding protein involved in type VI secretion